MNIHTPRTDPLRLATATIQAVDRIGESAAEGINQTAEEIIRGADEIAEKLRELAEAIKSHSKVAHQQVAIFCDKATSVLEGIRTLQEGLAGPAQEAEVAATSDDIPRFLSEGPADCEDHKPADSHSLRTRRTTVG
jgi:methyl-accepting chemotaxis protein